AARAQRRPVPRVREGLLVAPFASAAIDVSDGFLQDLGHICAESSVGAVVECSSLPLGKAARRLPDGMELALGGGEDYALLLTVPKRKRPLVCVGPDEEAAEALERDLRFFARDRAVVRIPGDEVLPYEGLTPDRFVAQQRLAALFRLHLGEQPIVVCSIKSVGRRVLPR